jgi:hypothetical protein
MLIIPKRILVPLDFPEDSQIALKYASDPASYINAEVYAFYLVQNGVRNSVSPQCK